MPSEYKPPPEYKPSPEYKPPSKYKPSLQVLTRAYKPRIYNRDFTVCSLRILVSIEIKELRSCFDL